jgi:glycosyltransferase involved in cell wall biosynthesis
MATYNGGKYIEEQVRSILPQLGKNDEIIISDDGSTDNTINILESFNDERIKIFYHDRRSVKVPFLLSSESADNFYFAARNFENALKKANGDYIFLSDQDDAWMPNKVEEMLKLLNEDRLVISNAWVTNDKMKQQYKLSEYVNYKKGFWKNIVIKGAPYGCLCAFTKNIKNFILPIPKNVLTHDFWLNLISELKFSSVYIPEPLVLYRRHANTVSKTNNSQNSTFFVVKYRLLLLYEVLLRCFLGNKCR